MVKTQVQIPNELYEQAKRVAREREISLAEVMRRGLEYIVRVYPPADTAHAKWAPPRPRPLGTFRSPAKDWRLLANESVNESEN